MYIYIFSLKIIFDRLIKKHISWYKVIDIEKQIPENAFLSILAISSALPLMQTTFIRLHKYFALLFFIDNFG